eukprot:GCRY01003132.1.p1 GENE.GCRY01003132.1~~GCRY01003132.1.p1  ORF type:complete len:466 (-),score=125.37 GCRY01003132.1:6-1403(-)
MLRISVLDGRGFPCQQKNGVPIPNVSFIKLNFENQAVRLKSVTHSGGPKWNSEHSFDVTSEGTELNVTVLNERKGGRTDFVGRVLIKVDELEEQQSLWYPLLRKSGERAKGELHLLVKYSKENIKDISMSDFDLLKVLGKGSYGKVMQVRKRDTGRIYAMKVMKKQAIIESNEVDHILSEKQILQHIKSPFIVGLKYAFQSEDKLYLVMDFVNGGELFYHLQRERKFTEERAKFYCAEIILALEHLHQQNIIYRDLKPENVLLNADGHVCLTDFGLCKEGVGINAKAHTFCGTPEYLAPEVIHGDARGYGRAVDWWSLGTLLYEMCVGIPPFYSQNVQEMYKKILHAPLRFPSNLSAECIELLQGLLHRDPAERVGSGVSDAEEVKSYPFFLNLDWAALERRDIDPPYRPVVASVEDTTNFDAEFTSERATDTVVEMARIQLAEDETGELFKAFGEYQYAQTPPQ